MKVLYIDKADSFEGIRIAEKNIFAKHLPSSGVYVDILIRSNTTDNQEFPFVYTWTKNNTRKRWSVLLDFVSAFRKANRLIRKRNYDVIIARKNLTTGYAAWLLSRIYKKKYVYLLSFPTWEIIRARGQNNALWNLLSSVYLKLTLILIRRADLVVPKTRYFWESLEEKYMLYGINHLPLPMGFDETMRPERMHRDAVREELNIPLKSNVLIYYGSMERERKLEFVIDIVCHLRAKVDNLRCYMIGGTSNQCAHLKRYAHQQNIARELHIISWLDRSVLYKYLAASDICISPLPPVPAFIISSPTKVVESLGFGVPVIANSEIYEQKEIIEQSRSGILVPYDTNAFVEGIRAMFRDHSELRAMGKRGLFYIERNRSYKGMAASLHKAIASLLS